MQLNHRGTVLALALLVLAGALACRITDTFLAQATAVPTRTPRPTFTPQPTATPTTTPTLVPPTPTRTPTRRPTARPTRRPPTQPPAPPPPTAVPQPQYKYKSVNKGCEHSGQTFIQGTIYDRGGGRINGVTVALSGVGPDGEVVATRQSGEDGDGFFSIIVNAYGASPGQKRWLWIVEGGKRVSDVVEFQFNNLKPEEPGVCWRGFVDFLLQY